MAVQDDESQQSEQDVKFMDLAYEQARTGYEEGGIPIVSFTLGLAEQELIRQSGRSACVAGRQSPWFRTQHENTKKLSYFARRNFRSGGCRTTTCDFLRRSHNVIKYSTFIRNLGH